MLTTWLKKKSSTPIGKFPAEYLRKIENAFPHEAIKLFQSWFTPAIQSSYQDLSQSLSQQDAKQLAENLTEYLLINIRKLPSPLYLELENKNRNNAIVCILFFVSMIRFLAPFAPTKVLNKRISPYRYVFSFLQLHRAIEFLYREHYRLFELGQLVTDTPKIHLNQDIEAMLMPLLSIESGVQVNTIPEVVINPIQADPAVLEQFIRWLKGKLKSHEPLYALNEGGLIYCSPLKFDDKTVFITDVLLTEYQRVKQIPPETLLTLLDSEKSYYCFQDDQKIPLYKISNVGWTQTMTKTITILEVS